jgi:hypothetical protein
MTFCELYKEIDKRLQPKEEISIRTNDDVMISIYKANGKKILFATYDVIDQYNNHTYIMLTNTDNKVYAKISGSTSGNNRYKIGAIYNNGDPLYMPFPNLEFDGCSISCLFDGYFNCVFALFDARKYSLLKHDINDRSNNFEKIITYMESASK